MTLRRQLTGSFLSRRSALPRLAECLMATLPLAAFVTSAAHAEDQPASAAEAYPTANVAHAAAPARVSAPVRTAAPAHAAAQASVPVTEVAPIAVAAADAAPVAAAPAPVPAPAPVAAAPAKDWLRTQHKEAAAPATSESSSGAGRLALLGLFLSGLGGAAIYLKRRQGGSGAKIFSSEVQVVSSARVGVKAQVVVIAIGGRKMLLGVTDAGVSRLAWLDGELEGDELVNNAAEQDFFTQQPDYGDDDEQEQPAVIRTPPREATMERPPMRGFREALFGALGQRHATVDTSAENVAASIADSTRDVVTRSSAAQRPQTNQRAQQRVRREPITPPAGAPEMIDIEGQARGLLLRLQKRA